MSKTIAEIDKNFDIETSIGEENTVFLDAAKAPFDVYGLIEDDGREFVRMPQSIAKTVNGGVKDLNLNTAGGRLRFKTDSEYVAVKVFAKTTGYMPHMTMTGSSGFDMYEKENGEYTYLASFLPGLIFSEFSENGGYENITHFGERRLRDLTINFPLYNSVDKLYIGLEKDAVLESGDEYGIKKPIVFYGSSITQGGCASRPGNAYSNIISRRYDADTVNLGFSGSCRSEKEMADYIAGLDMSVFVYDYDHNAPTAEHLEKTHKPLFDTFRKAHPEIPVILMSRPKLKLNEEEIRRKSIVYDTYKSAKNGGDENVYFIPGDEIFKIHGGDGCTVDGCHPNDLGFMCMADALTDVLDLIFGRRKGK